MSSYFYKGTDISTIISTSNPYNGNSKSILTTSYISFPPISAVTINNSNFDKSLNVDTGYSVNGTDIANQIPAYVEFYTSTLNTNIITIPVNSNTAFDVSSCTFNSPKTYTLTIPNIYSGIGIILCGGGGGGGWDRTE